jgi:lipid-A-disaccharide synthase
MAEQGVHLLAGLEDLAVMGFFEVARRLRFFMDLRRRVRDDLREHSASLLIPVDYPGFNLPLAGHAHGRGIPVLYYIAPQVWAWKERRARKLAQRCDRVLTVLPFEDALLRRYGVDSRFVGHPLLDDPPRPGATANPSSHVLGLFPGSREQEVERMLPLFAAAARRLRSTRPDLECLIARASHIPGELYERTGLPTAPASDVIAAARVALTKSGTITLELALAGVPMVVGYRAGAVTYQLARRLIRVPSITLANLVVGEPVIPELIQGEATPESLADAVTPLLEDGEARSRMLADLERVCAALGTPGAAGRVADHAVELLG